MDLDPDDATIAENKDERNEKSSYVLVRFGSEEYGEQDDAIPVPDDERANYDMCFPNLNELLNSCFKDWEASRGRFEDAGSADRMEELMMGLAAQWS